MIPIVSSRRSLGRALLFSFGVLQLSALPLLAQRVDQVLADGWKFVKKDAGIGAKSDSWETVSVPHTWNVSDGSNGLAPNSDQPEGYYRGPAWYARPLEVAPDWKGKRVFIRFEAAALVSDVFVNNIHVGQHRGGFAAFCYEIGRYLKYDGKDTLKVRVDNARTFDVAPLSGDFTIFGGIYRPVHLFATSESCISPLEFGSFGVYFSYKGLDGDNGKVDARVVLSNSSADALKQELQFEVQNPDGRVATTTTLPVTVAPGQADYQHSFAIPNAHLWNGRKDPYLYTVKIRLLQDGKVIDEVTQPLGLRTVALTQDKGFLLNDQPYALYGVNRHQEKGGKGWAVSDQDHRDDLAMIMEIGATALRLAHYQQADIVHDLTDRGGLITWQEIPVVDCVSGAPEALANSRQQYTEMVYQGWNHPSLCMWSVFNELDASWAAVKTAPSVPYIKALSDYAHKLDPSRLVVGASWPQDPTALHQIPDAMGWNIYPGWYSASVEDATSQIDNYSKKMGGKRIALSEYGAGGNPMHFAGNNLKQPKQDGPFHPQEWQNHFHEGVWRQARNNPQLWATFVWAMFDFAVDKRNEGGKPGVNDKGLVTQDRKIKKDSFYFYKANWNPEPMVYLTSKLNVERTEDTTEIKAYSNCDEVELKVNGTSIGKGKPDDEKIIKWPNVALKKGVNKIELTGTSGEKVLQDQADWTLK